MLKDGVWPGLEPETLYNGQLPQVTADFRHIFAEVLTRHMLLKISEMAPIFPGSQLTLGILLDCARRAEVPAVHPSCRVRRTPSTR